MKKLVAISLMLVFAFSCLASCGGYVTLTLEPTSNPVSTEDMETAGLIEGTIYPTSVPYVTVTPDGAISVLPEDTVDPDLEAVYDYFGGVDYMWDYSKSHIYGGGFEVWPLNYSSVNFCPLAFWDLNFLLYDVELNTDYLEKILEPESEYTWFISVSEGENFDSIEDFSQPYECVFGSYYDFGNGAIIYRIQPEVDMDKGPTSSFEVGKTYQIAIQFVHKETGEVQGWGIYSFEWTQFNAESYSLYKYFWSTRDRSMGYSAGAWEVEENDIEYAKSHGYEWDYDFKCFKYVGQY